MRSAILVVLLIFSCADNEQRGSGQNVPAVQPPPEQHAKEALLSRYDIGSKHPRSFGLPKALREASGLAMTPDGRLFMHNDEEGIVFEVDYRSGKVVKRFTIGSGLLHEDFEGIAVKDDTLFVTTSGGTIFQFHEGEDRSRVSFKRFDTFLSRRYDVEGLEYDPETDCLLLACKGYAGKNLDTYKAVYAFSLKSKNLLKEPRFLIPLDAIKGKSRRAKFNPSGLARHSASGHFFLISANASLIVELDKEGRVLAQADIPHKTNPQPEGIAFSLDDDLILCNDQAGGTGILTVYSPSR